MAAAIFKAGRYLPLRLEADAPGVVRVRGRGVQAIDWDAAGRSQAVVPLLIFDEAEDELDLSVNGRPVRLPLHTLTTAEADPPEWTAFWQAVDPVPPAAPAIDADANELAALWRPGRSDATRQWTLSAVAVIVLTIAVATYADPKRTTLWLTVAGVGLSAGVVVLFPNDTPRRVLPAEGRPGWDWVWLACGGAAHEAWSPGLRFVPASVESLDKITPVLTCDAAGRPVAINVPASGRSDLDRRLVFTSPRPASPSE